MGGLAFALGLLFAPRVHPHSEVAVPKRPRRARTHAPAQRATVRSPAAHPRPAPLSQPQPQPLPQPLSPAPGGLDPVAMGWISGHVVDGTGEPVGGAVLHLQGPTGAMARRIADDGEFNLHVREGTWTVEAGWFDGEDEWRSIPTTVELSPGATATLAIEILMGSAGHMVHAGLREAMGVGWEVVHDDGPLRAGDVLVEVDGRLLADLQPEAVRAALRERPGEAIPAMVLRADGTGKLEEVTVLLEAR